MDDINAELLVAIGRMEGKLDAVDARTARFEKKFDEQDRRLGSVERRQTYAMGAAGAGGFLLSLALGIAGMWK